MWYSRWVHAAPACAALFVVAALTDFLDGYLARLMVRMSPTPVQGIHKPCVARSCKRQWRYVCVRQSDAASSGLIRAVRVQGTVSAFGAFLDPVADKLMVATVLILISTHPIASGSLAGNDWLLPTLSTGEERLVRSQMDTLYCMAPLR